MKKTIPIAGWDTGRGYCTISIAHDDITLLTDVDAIVISAFAGSYAPVKGTMIEALEKAHPIVVAHLAAEAELDLRQALGEWVSKELTNLPFRLVIGVEVRGRLPWREALANVFATVMLLEAKNKAIRSLAMPMLGTGRVRLDSESVASVILENGLGLLQRSSALEKLMIVEQDLRKFQMLESGLEKLFARSTSSILCDGIVQGLKEEVLEAIVSAIPALRSGSSLRNDWIVVLQRHDIRSFELGVLSRRTLEAILDALEVPGGTNISARIQTFADSGAPRYIISYMHLIRVIGNVAAHFPGDMLAPPTSQDLAIAMMCVSRLLRYVTSIRQ